ncbi:hypothetical protein Q5O14_16495 [Eubacteriaceae bacterium ES2]|nr:hypothetical protein Q5O14_16495 [Eubacteriaceae bacterium ES2]
MAMRYSSLVKDGKLNVRQDYIQTESGDFQKLTPNWVRKAYEKAQELKDTESIEKLENLVLDVFIKGEDDHPGRRIDWCLKDELNQQ